MWFLGSGSSCNCNCSSEISRLRRAIESLEENRKREYQEQKMFTNIIENRLPIEFNKIEFDYQYQQDNAPDYLCRGGANGQMPTEFSTTDIENVVSDHLKEIVPADNDACVGVSIPFTFLLFVPFYLSITVSNLRYFIHTITYPTFKVMYENEWGCAGNVRIILYDDNQLKNNRKSECTYFKAESGQKVYSSFLVSINENDKTQKVTHIKSTRN